MELPLHSKALALNALSEISLKMDIKGHWYVNQSVEFKERPDAAVLVGKCGRGETPDEALFNHWKMLSGVKAPALLVIQAYGDKRRHVRWNGFMWEDVV